MGCKQHRCFSCLGNAHTTGRLVVVICLLTFILLIQNKPSLLVNGRSVPSSSSNTPTPTTEVVLLKEEQPNNNNNNSEQHHHHRGKKTTTREIMRAAVLMIGSRPPRCKLSCSSCVHCEPIQVPVVPQTRVTKSTSTPTLADDRQNHAYEANAAAAFSRGDALSNYKPMSWKCKCGNFIFNP